MEELLETLRGEPSTTPGAETDNLNNSEHAVVKAEKGILRKPGKLEEEARGRHNDTSFEDVSVNTE